MSSTSTAATTKHKVVSQQEWVEARKELLAAEKELTHLRDAIAAKRRELPWVKVEKNYIFDGPHGKLSLADLFQNRSQLIIYHFMFGPDWQEGCPSCSFGMDHTDGALPHLAQRDISFAAVSRAPISKIEPFKQRLGWRFPWVSSGGNDFNRDFHVSFSKEELAKGKVEYNYTQQSFPSDEAPGLSVFFKNAAGEIFHTYSTYGRGLDTLMGAYNFMDMTPKGRNEDSLPFTMAWVRHHDRYETGALADANKPYWPDLDKPAPPSR
jgi:predicted dithiol-disulfide oxidoreductase (DUF899 family)